MNTTQTLRQKAYSLVDSENNDYFDIGLLVLVVINLFILVFETVPEINKDFGAMFDYIEYFSIGVFTFEYVLRVWSIVEHPGNEHPIKGRLKYIFSFMGLVDLLSFGFFYIGMNFKILKVIRVMRLFKASRYLAPFRFILDVVLAKKKELLMMLMILLVFVFTSSVLIYYAEHDIQPDKFTSIPASMWWSVITMTSVGYGDISPVTVLGKFVGVFTAVFGIMLFALPTGIIASSFTEQIEEKKRNNTKQIE